MGKLWGLLVGGDNMYDGIIHDIIQQIRRDVVNSFRTKIGMKELKA